MSDFQFFLYIGGVVVGVVALFLGKEPNGFRSRNLLLKASSKASILFFLN
jgi:hypothetical protein